ncbi:hypothetical protein [Halalkalicoccus ordinarius]|uniref:hypothetical protein n=1 Tax=Halalkalicoccus ordinarius TaxID=3116651 RepID=UPI00300EFD87
MNDDGGISMSVDEFVEYCRTQAGLLSGEVETMSEAADDLLAEIDEGLDEVRTRLDGRATGVERAEAPAGGPNAGDVDVAAIEELEAALEEKQAVLEAKRTRMNVFRELAAGYTDLAEELRSDVNDGREAMERVVRFEADRDAPAYFDRQTVCEAASSEPDDG